MNNWVTVAKGEKSPFEFSCESYTALDFVINEDDAAKNAIASLVCDECVKVSNEESFVGLMYNSIGNPSLRARREQCTLIRS